MPGRLLTNLREMARTCGGHSAAATDAMIALYGTIVRARLDRCDCVTAELVKTAENAYRDVNIAFANELALICETAGADFLRVRELVNQSPGRDVLMAGAGVGGHCIPKDPWLLVHGAGREHRARPSLIAAGRAVNDSMPLHVADLVEEALESAGVAVHGAVIAVFGYSYLEGSGDTRSSPTVALVDHLSALGAAIVIHDPWVREHAGDPYGVAAGADAAIFMVAHAEYRGLDLSRLKQALRRPVLVDGRFVVDEQAARSCGFVFRGVGRASGGAT
jgi:UDP-N-acetyl-D-mannosaminuronic acid dehydrogenase